METVSRNVTRRIPEQRKAAAIDAVFEVIGDAMQSKDKVQLIGFGTFQTSERKARTGRNPQTGETIKVAACTVPAFKAGKGLREKVNTKPAKKK
jgi:DNA-binding protein HU-beta